MIHEIESSLPKVRARPVRYRASTITRELRSRILSGDWKPRQRIPTEHELARQFGVARSTVVRSLRQMEKEELLWCRRGEGRFVVEPVQRRRTATIGVVVHDMTLLNYPTTARYLAGIHDACLRAHYHVQTLGFNPHVRHNGLEQVLEQLDATRLDGLILLTWLIPEQHVNELAMRMPIVWVARISNSPLVGTVGGDLLGGVFEATNHLMQLGHRRLALVTVGAGTLQGFHQREGIRLALNRHLPGHERRLDVFSGDTNVSREWIEPFRQSLGGANRPTAVIFGSHELAEMGLAVVQQLHLNIPRDLSVIEVHDAQVSTRSPVPLTKVQFDVSAIGREAAEMLVQIIADPTAPREPRFVATELLVRQSTAPPCSLNAVQQQP